jgi:hypothetical protein
LTVFAIVANPKVDVSAETNQSALRLLRDDSARLAQLVGMGEGAGVQSRMAKDDSDTRLQSHGHEDFPRGIVENQNNTVDFSLALSCNLLGSFISAQS